MADPTDLAPVTRAEFAAQLAPCLALVAPIGMDEGAKLTWYNAAFKALEGIPIGLLARGVRVAMTTADHPAKIVAAIMAEVGGAWEQRRRLAMDYRPPADPPCRAPLAVEEAKELGTLMEDLARKLRCNQNGDDKE